MVFSDLSPGTPEYSSTPVKGPSLPNSLHQEPQTKSQDSVDDTRRQHPLNQPDAHVDPLDGPVDRNSYDLLDSPKPAKIPRSSTSPSHLNPRTPRLHCRRCHANPCKDLTATMCGHIFCNKYVLLRISVVTGMMMVFHRCITEVVVASSRCPVCNNPTLLYCLFRIDLS